MLVKITRCMNCNKELKDCKCISRKSDGGWKEVKYTGDLKDSTSTKIADVVNGLITAVYY